MSKIIIGFAPGYYHWSFDRDWIVFTNPKELLNLIEAPIPKGIYFIHWHWKVPEKVINAAPCVGFHMTDLPFGRGGRPYENLLKLGFKQTMVTAFELTPEWDAGPVLMKKPTHLSGNKKEDMTGVYTACSYMIYYIERNGAPMRIPQEEYFTKRFKR